LNDPSAGFRARSDSYLIKRTADLSNSRTAVVSRATSSPIRLIASSRNKSSSERLRQAAAAVFEPKVGDTNALDAVVATTGAWRDALAKRDEAIKAAVKAGTSARQVALAVG
jgi:hypothetical protein